MKNLLITGAMLLALATPASATAAAMWLTEPACTATTTTLTCGGRAAISNPRPIRGLGPPVAAIIAQVRYHCSDPESDLLFPGLGTPLQYVASVDFHNGQTFSIQFSPPPEPWTIEALFSCNDLWVLKDPTYYNVRVALGWGLGSATPVTALEGPIGTVSQE